MSAGNKKIKVNEVITAFSISPKFAYEKLITSNLYFKSGFWIEFAKLDLIGLTQKFQDSAYYIHKANGLRFFHELREFYDKAVSEKMAKLYAINPTPVNLLKALFLAIELGDAGSPIIDLKYTSETLQAVKTIFKEFIVMAKPDGISDYSVELFNDSSHILRLQTDRIMLDNFLDIFLTDNFLLFPKEQGLGYELRLIDESLKQTDIYILGQLKSAVKRDFKKTDSQPKISMESHFMDIDPELKTDKGFAPVYYSSNCIVTEKGEGYTSLQMDDSIFELMLSADPVKQAEGQRKLMEKMMNRNFHYRHRQTLADTYQPNDEIDIKKQSISIQPGKSITLYELLAAISSLVAFADNLRFLSESNIPHLRNSYMQIAKFVHPTYTDEQLIRVADSNIVFDLPRIHEKKEPPIFLFLSKEMLLGTLIQITELKSKSVQELSDILDFISSTDNPMPFNFIYKTIEGYYFSYQTCTRFPVLRDIYDYYISEKLFNSVGKELIDRGIVGKNHAERTEKLNNSLIELFLQITPNAKSIKYDRVDPKYNLGNLKGDIDVLVYFQQENILLPIQVKLKNVSVQNEKGKMNWVKTNIEEKGTDQVQKDIELLTKLEGLKFISDELGLPSTITHAQIYPLIITDNVFADHVEFAYNKNEDSVLCISYFELKHLLLNQKIHEKQNDWPDLIESKSVRTLIDLIEGNVFWDFLGALIPNYHCQKSLTVINDENKIHFMI